MSCAPRRAARPAYRSARARFASTSPTIAPTWATATVTPSTDPVLARTRGPLDRADPAALAAMSHLFGLLVPRNAVADTCAEPPLRRLGSRLDRLPQHRQLLAGIEPGRMSRI